MRQLQSLAQLWTRIPVIGRAVAVGSLVSVVGHMPDNLLIANLRFGSRIPWSTPLVGLCLWLFWQYAGGRWWPASTAEERREDLRARPLSASVWRWSLLAGGLAMTSLWALHFALARLLPSPSYQVFYELFRTTPFLTMATFVVMASVVAGVSEEAAFRGYMQGPIERRHGSVVAIVVVSIIFVLAHYTDILEMTASRVLFILVASICYGIIVRLTGSILPGLVLHAVGDATQVSVLWWLWAASGGVPLRSIQSASPWSDPLLTLYSAEALAFGTAAVWAFFALARVVRREPEALPHGSV